MTEANIMRGDAWPSLPLEAWSDDVLNAKSPEDTLLDFLQSTYEATADLAKWDRASLEGLRYL